MDAGFGPLLDKKFGAGAPPGGPGGMPPMPEEDMGMGGEEMKGTPEGMTPSVDFAKMSREEIVGTVNDGLQYLLDEAGSDPAAAELQSIIDRLQTVSADLISMEKEPSGLDMETETEEPSDENLSESEAPPPEMPEEEEEPKSNRFPNKTRKPGKEVNFV